MKHPKSIESQMEDTLNEKRLKRELNSPEMRWVFIIQHVSTFYIYGCFDSLDKANSYIKGNENFAVIKAKVN